MQGRHGIPIDEGWDISLAHIEPDSTPWKWVIPSWSTPGYLSNLSK